MRITVTSRGARLAACAASLAVACLLCLCAPSFAQSRSVGIDSAPTTLVLRFSRENERLVGRDVPVLEIYGDGRVVAHRPAYMLDPGDWEWSVGPGELKELLSSLATDGLLEYDAEKVERDKRDFRAKEAREGRAWEVADTTETIIEVDFASYDPGGGAAPVGRVRKTIRGVNFQADAEHMNGIAALGGMSRIERRLLQLEKQAVARGRRR